MEEHTGDRTYLHQRGADHWLRVDGWGENSVRVRAGRGVPVEVPGALLDDGGSNAIVEIAAEGSVLTNGELRVVLSSAGNLTFSRVSDGVELVAEEPAHFAWPGSRLFASTGNGFYRLEQRFRAYAGERVFGLGQHQHGRLDQKGMVIDLVQRNAEVTIPFLVSSRGYGFLWNLPAIGRVEFAENGTRWVADSARQIDYWVTTGPNPAAILGNFADATGHSPAFPTWAAGLWQSKLRYRTQEELLSVARDYHSRGLPLDVIVADYYHWTRLGDWRFDPHDWPDVEAMTEELKQLGARLMVSVWPSLSPLSTNYQPMRDAGHLIRTEQGLPTHHLFPDKGFDGQPLGVSFYDATSADAREYLWDQVRANYFEHGVKLWWLDGCEPEMYPEQPGNLLFAAGTGGEVANLYPREHTRGFYEHMLNAGESDVVCLTRSAWAGSQRYGALLWSGDIDATFAALRAQVRAGLNVAMSGIPWWTTDIGGFHGGDPDSLEYRELLTRWFQYAVFCPVLRMHGHREPREGFTAGHTGGPNELWSYGPDTYQALVGQLQLRQRLRDYIVRQMGEASRSGLPPMRPIFVDFPADESAWSVDDQYMFGPDLLVAPITEAGAVAWTVYLPGGATWVDTATGEEHRGGVSVELETPIQRIPVLCRAGASVLDVWGIG